MPTRHPAQNFIKYLIVLDPTIGDGNIQKRLEDLGMLSADPTYLPLLRQEIPPPPAAFLPTSRSHRESVRFLRGQQLYEIFHNTEDMQQAWEILRDPDKRTACERMLLGRVDLKATLPKVNAKNSWHLTIAGVNLFKHYFWNVPLLSFDEWGRFMYNRNALYEQYMGLLLSNTPTLTYYHLRIHQQVESKKMIQRVQDIAYHTLEELGLKPGAPENKVKGINLLGKIVIEAHNALSTSDMALKDVLKQFENWRMDHPNQVPPSLRDISQLGSFSGSGKEDQKKLPN